MSNITSEPVCCEGVIHKVSLTVDKKGIEGAAVVYIPGAGAAGPPPYEKVYHDFVVTGAFGFVITDTYGTVVFSGVINILD
jgi:serine protease inhibitor